MSGAALRDYEPVVSGAELKTVERAAAEGQPSAGDIDLDVPDDPRDPS